MSNQTKTVMIIDDSGEFRESMKEFLEGNDWVVDDHASASDAIKKLKSMNTTPDLILLDYLMPIENGISFWNSLNDDPNLCHIPTVMMTAHEMNSINVLGIRAMVKKPVDTDGLLTLMNTLRNEKILNLTPIA